MECDLSDLHQLAAHKGGGAARAARTVLRESDRHRARGRVAQSRLLQGKHAHRRQGIVPKNIENRKKITN